MLTKAPAALDTWASYFAEAPVPVLSETVSALAELLPQQDDVTVSHLAPLVLGDPLMTVKLLAHVAQRRSARSETGSETVAQAILMMGVQPFFNAFAEQPVIEAELAGSPAALQEVQGVLERSRRAALFALSFAVHRKDPDAEIIHEAALMHDFAEMLLWCHAPALALRVKQVKAENPTMRSAQVQRQVLNIELSDLEHALLQTWRLPELLVRITNEHLADDPQAKTVFLGWRIARHSGAGWENPSLAHDYRDAADLLGLSVDVVRSKVMKLDEQEPSGTDVIAATPA